MTTKLKYFFPVVFSMLWACGIKENKIKQQQNYYQLLQGPWQSRDSEIYYIKGDSSFVFKGKYYWSTYTLRNDTLEGMSMLGWYGKAAILSISKDSLSVKNPVSGELVMFSRPTIEALQKDTVTHKPDSIISTAKRKILGEDFDFKVLAEHKDHLFLTVQPVQCGDSCLKFTHALWTRGGDCNGTSEYEAVFELAEDKVIFYICDTYIEHFDDFNPHALSDYFKETYEIRKEGRIVRIKTEQGKGHPEIKKEIISKIGNLSLRK